MSAAISLVAMTAVSAAGQLYSGRQQQKAYNAQAAQARIQGRSQAIAYKQQAADVLRRVNETNAAIITRAAAGNIDPSSGSAQALQNRSMKEGIREYNTSLDNSQMALGMADYQSKIYKDAGRTAMATAYIKTAGTIYGGYQRSQQTGFPALSLSGGMGNYGGGMAAWT